MNQLTVYFRTNRHFDQIVIYITYDPGRRPQFNTLMRENITTNNAVENNVWYRNATFDDGIFTDAQSRITVRIGTNVALDCAIDVAATLEEQISDHS